MPLTINFTNAVQDSVQIGDTAYFMPTTNQTTAGNMINAATGASMATVAEYGAQTDISELGLISVVGATSITIDPIGNDVDRPSNGDFILFSKDNLANMSSLAGYYAEVKMENNSNTEVELFAISSEIVESSK